MLPVAKEAGWLIYALILAAVAAFSFSAQWLGSMFAIAAILLLLIFRDFRRIAPPHPLFCISPVDGTVESVDEALDPYLNRPAVCVTIRQSYWGEFNLHAPVEGKIEQLWLTAPGGSGDDLLAYCITTDENDRVVTAIDLASVLRHASTSLNPGERIGQGQRCGFAAFGCKVNVYLPANVTAAVISGSRLKAGVDSLATLVHS